MRTVSQFTTFIRELALVKKKRPKLKTVYLVGKESMCPLGGEGDIYRRCEGVKQFSSALMRDWAEKGSLVPSKDPFIVQQIRCIDREHPVICPYFIASKMFVPGELGREDGAFDKRPLKIRTGPCRCSQTTGTRWFGRGCLPI